MAQRIRGIDVVGVLEGVVKQHGLPQTIQVDNGPEFISKDLYLGAYWNKVKLDFSRPGKPTDNAFIESFNGRSNLFSWRNICRLRNLPKMQWNKEKEY